MGLVLVLDESVRRKGWREGEAICKENKGLTDDIMKRGDTSTFLWGGGRSQGDEGEGREVVGVQILCLWLAWGTNTATHLEL